MRIMSILLLLLTVSNAWGLNVRITTKVKGGDKPFVFGKTNLPDKTELVISIKCKKSSCGGQAKAIVSGGIFHAGPFTQKGAPFNLGIYTLTVTAPFAPLQPSSVQAFFGAHGENLNGPFVKKVGIGKLVEYQTSFKIAGAVSAEKDDQARKQDKNDIHEWWQNQCLDLCIAAQDQYGKRTGNMYNFDWDQCYNKCLLEEGKK
jgi:hypothetical protein